MRTDHEPTGYPACDCPASKAAQALAAYTGTDREPIAQAPGHTATCAYQRARLDTDRAIARLNQCAADVLAHGPDTPEAREALAMAGAVTARYTAMRYDPDQ